jgi:hypothetical protein
MRSLFSLNLLLACFAAAAQAANPPPQAPISGKQLSQCMTKRMMASRTISYNEAARRCKEELGERKLEASAQETPKHIAGT